MAATFFRLVTTLHKGLEYCSGAYLDDIIIFSNTWEEHLKHLRFVFNRVRDAGLTLNLKKCVFATGEVDYFGQHLGLGKVQPIEMKVEALMNFPRPTQLNSTTSYTLLCVCDR